MKSHVWQLLQEYREIERLVRENPDVARLFDDQDINRPVPWWQENHRGMKKRRKVGAVVSNLS